jgi:signal transduction histidine kinase
MAGPTLTWLKVATHVSSSTPQQYTCGTEAGSVLAHKLVKKHGGKLWAELVAGRGATFFLLLSNYL